MFVHASTDAQERQSQWEELKGRKQVWEDKWIVGGDFNDIKNHEKKKGEKKRPKSRFCDFKNFVSEMGIVDIMFKGEICTWINNREGEGFI